MSARAYAEAALAAVGAPELASALPRGLDDAHPAQRWRDTGLAALTGWPDRAPVRVTRALPHAADGALAALEAVAGSQVGPLAGGTELLAERAQLLGLTRAGRVSPGRSCRLLAARDGWLAVNLARDSDAPQLAAWLEDDALCGAERIDAALWERVAASVADRSAETCETRARWLGLAVARAAAPPPESPGFFRIALRGQPGSPPRRAPRVVDLSSLWAGPLAGRLLARAGASVRKLECVRRPDGARFGSAAFFSRLNACKTERALDFRSAAGLTALRAELEGADLVIESARPRGLAQLGIDAEAWVCARPGRVWVSITGHGRAHDGVAFGDDAAIAGGIGACVEAEAPLFVGDAIADPLTGLHAALAALATWQRGESALLDLALARVVGHVLASVPRLAI